MRRTKALFVPHRIPHVSDGSLTLSSILQRKVTIPRIRINSISRNSKCHACTRSVMNPIPETLITHPGIQSIVQQSHQAKIPLECEGFRIFSMLHKVGLWVYLKTMSHPKF